MVTTTMNFMERDALYDEEKPFLLTFEPPEDFPRTNVKLGKHNLTMTDIRGFENNFSVEKNGFSVMPITSALSYEDFNNDESIKKVYLKELAEHVKEFLGATKVQVFEHIVRKRHPDYPISTGEPYAYNQPTSIAHIDTTPEWSMEMARKLNPSIKETELASRRIQCVNLWKPLKGPLQDWPLGVCDISSVDINDIRPGDLVHPNFVIENCQVHHNIGQKWYFLSNQSPDEAWLFIQSDSKYPWIRSGVPHSSFPYPATSLEAIPRESIEARCLVFYD